VRAWHCIDAMPEPAWRRRFRAARVTLPSWSRDDSDRLLYASNIGGKWELYAWQRLADSHRQVTDRAEGTIVGTLDPSGESIWWFDDEKGDELGQWCVEPFRGGARRPAVPLPAAYSAGLALARSFAIAGFSDDSGARVSLVRDGEIHELYAHREHAYVAGLSRDETLLCISHSEHGDSLHRALRVMDLRGARVAELWDGPGLGLHPAGWSLVPGDQRLLVVHERRDLPRPLIWNVAENAVDDLTIELPGEVDATWYPDGSALLVDHEYRGRSELYRFDIGARTLTRLETEPGQIFDANVRPDGEVWYWWTRSSTPSEIRGRSGTVLRPRGEPAPGGVAYRDHEVDGIPVFMAEPAGARPHPTIFLVHGGPTAHDSDAFSPEVQAWVDHGYAVVLVNYRGSTGYGRKWRDALIGSPGFTELADIAAVRRYVLDTGLADPRRLILAGGSWGGYLTLLGLGTQPELWSLGIAAVPVADYPVAFDDEMEPLKAYDRSLFGGSPQELPDLYRERSPLTYADRVAVPLLILAGENDPRCPIRQIDNYVARLRELEKPHEVYRYDAGHGSLVIDETLRQTETQLAFASRHLGTMPPQR
jgi:dipeptidyl aminopeptidase/acylaminoacyl peptidase